MGVQHIAAKIVENIATTAGRYCKKFLTKEVAHVSALSSFSLFLIFPYNCYPIADTSMAIMSIHVLLHRVLLELIFLFCFFLLIQHHTYRVEYNVISSKSLHLNLRSVSHV